MNFTLNKAEKQKYKAWIAEHDKIPDTSKCTELEVVFIECSGIGINVEVRCACGEKRDITDYSSW